MGQSQRKTSQIQTGVTVGKRRTDSQGLGTCRSPEGKRRADKDPDVSSLDVWGNTKRQSSEEEKVRGTLSLAPGLECSGCQALFNNRLHFCAVDVPTLDVSLSPA